MMWSRNFLRNLLRKKKHGFHSHISQHHLDDVTLLFVIVIIKSIIQQMANIVITPLHQQNNDKISRGFFCRTFLHLPCGVLFHFDSFCARKCHKHDHFIYLWLNTPVNCHMYVWNEDSSKHIFISRSRSNYHTRISCFFSINS